jgi:hypothetical protein
LNDLPLFITNKALALTFAVNLFFLTNLTFKNINRKVLGITTYFIAILHSIISVILLATPYFDSFYIDGKLCYCAAVMMLFGVAAVMTMVLIQKNFMYRHRFPEYWSSFSFEKAYILFLIFIALHIFVYFVNGWFDVNSWPGGLPPISMISFVFIVISTIQFFHKRLNE